MARDRAALEIPLAARPAGAPVARWLSDGLRAAILEGKLRPGARLPATRDFASHYRVARGTAVEVFEQLKAEGYLESRAGSGTWVSQQIPDELLNVRPSPPPRSAKVFREGAARPFRPNEPAILEFPMALWARVASRRLRRAPASLLSNSEAHGYAPLREAIAEYLGSARGVRCAPQQVLVVSGTQQALDVLARFLLKPGDAVWMEDPGYVGATRAFRSAGARVVPVRVDERGLDVPAAIRRAPKARAAYVTPAHQFPLGPTLPIDRRLALLEWAAAHRAWILEDDYDSEYRFAGSPVPAMQGLDRAGTVIFLGSFNKVLFPSLRLGYVVVPEPLVEPLAAFRFQVDRFTSTLDQAILRDFIAEGHFARHIRRMRELYAERLGAFRDAVRRDLDGILEIPPFDAGLTTAGLLRNGMTSRQAQEAAAERGVESISLEHSRIARRDVEGLLLGFANFAPQEIRRGVGQLAGALGA